MNSMWNSFVSSLTLPSSSPPSILSVGRNEVELEWITSYERRNLDDRTLWGFNISWKNLDQLKNDPQSGNGTIDYEIHHVFCFSLIYKLLWLFLCVCRWKYTQKMIKNQIDFHPPHPLISSHSSLIPSTIHQLRRMESILFVVKPFYPTYQLKPPSNSR